MKAIAIMCGAATWGILWTPPAPYTTVFEARPSEAAGVTEPRPDVAVLSFAFETVVAEVVDTPAERAVGLQFRDNLPDGTGMLFVFESEAPRSFWMKDTYIALDIAYLDVNFRIVDIQQMEPQTEELHPSARPAMFALEVRKGWFAEKGIAVGAQATVVFDPPGVRIN